MKNLVIIGNGSYSAMMKRYIELTDFGSVLAFAVDEKCIRESVLEGSPVIPLETLRNEFPPEKVELIMGIGYTQMGQIRKEIFETCKIWGYQFANYIHPTAILEKNVILGEGNNILEGVILEESVRLGNANLLFGGSMIAHETTVGNYNTFSVKAVVAGAATIRDNCFLGASSAVKDHVTLKDYVLIGATAFAFKDMEEYSVVVPARSMVLEDKKSTDYL